MTEELIRPAHFAVHEELIQPMTPSKKESVAQDLSATEAARHLNHHTQSNSGTNGTSIEAHEMSNFVQSSADFGDDNVSTVYEVPSLSETQLVRVYRHELDNSEQSQPLESTALSSTVVDCDYGSHGERMPTEQTSPAKKIASNNNGHKLCQFGRRMLNAVDRLINTIKNKSNHKVNNAKGVEAISEDISRDDDDGLRVNWKPIRNLSDTALCELVLRVCDPEGKVPLYCTDVLWRTQGAYHYIACVGLYRENHLEEYIIRIPGHGIKKSWTDEDAYNLEREVDTMQYVHRYTNVPVPKISGHCSTCENPLGFPFILMAAIEGDDAYDLWFDQPYGADTAWKHADEPTKEVEQKRINFLRSLACIMSSLQGLSFNKIGLPIMEDDSSAETTSQHPAGPSYHFRSPTNIHEPTEQPAFTTTQDFIKYGMDQRFGAEVEQQSTDQTQSDKTLATIGARKIMDIVFSQPAFNLSNGPETFTLHHKDLDLQNILIDEEGNIVGIIDWDGAYAAPRCIGAAAVPMFLRKDWGPAYCNGLDKSPYMAWNTEHYRQIYAAALLEVNDEDPDIKFTTKSAIYHAAIASLSDEVDAHDFTNKILREIPGIRMSPIQIKVGLGKGWPACEKMLEREIAKIMAPELPETEHLHHNANAHIAALSDTDDA